MEHEEAWKLIGLNGIIFSDKSKQMIRNTILKNRINNRVYYYYLITITCKYFLIGIRIMKYCTQ